MLRDVLSIVASCVRGTKTRPVRISVSSNEVEISASFPKGWRRSIRWRDLRKIAILTTADGPFGIDFYWELYGSGEAPVMVLPNNAMGMDELLVTFQGKLKNFNNSAVIDAAACVETASFLVWQAS